MVTDDGSMPNLTSNEGTNGTPQIFTPPPEPTGYNPYNQKLSNDNHGHNNYNS